MAAPRSPSLNPFSDAVLIRPPLVMVKVFSAVFEGRRFGPGPGRPPVRGAQLPGQRPETGHVPAEPGAPAVQTLQACWTLLWSAILSLDRWRPLPGSSASRHPFPLVGNPAQQSEARRARQLVAEPRSLRIRVLLLASFHLGKKGMGTWLCLITCSVGPGRIGLSPSRWM